jgi:hypothetical protein
VKCRKNKNVTNRDGLDLSGFGEIEEKEGKRAALSFQPA